MKCYFCKRPIDEQNCIEIIEHHKGDVFITEKLHFCNKNCLAMEMLRYMELSSK